MPWRAFCEAVYQMIFVDKKLSKCYAVIIHECTAEMSSYQLEGMVTCKRMIDNKTVYSVQVQARDFKVMVQFYVPPYELSTSTYECKQ